MSEFIPTTTATFYTTYTPFDDYDEDEDFTESVVLENIPISILTARVRQYQPVDNRGTTVKEYVGRIRGHYDLRLDYLVEDDRTGIRYSIQDIDKMYNPIGDAHWVLSLKKVPTQAGQ